MESRVETLLNALINGETLEFNPQSRMEEYLKNCINKTGVEGLPEPQSRLDALLYSLAEVLVGSGGDTTAAFEAGKKAERDVFWEVFQKGGARTNYYQAFAYGIFSLTTFYPKYDMMLEGDGSLLFYAWETEDSRGSLKQRLEECGVKLDTSKCTSLYNAFAYTQLTELPTIDLSGIAVSNGTHGTFSNSWGKTHTIEKIIVAETTPFRSTTFEYAQGLINVIFEGVIGQNGLYLQWSTKLSHESLMSILNCLQDKSNDTSGTEWVVTIGSENYAKLTEDELTIAYNKGWNIY